MPSPSTLAAALNRDRKVRHGAYGKPIRVNGQSGSAIYSGIHYTGPQTDGGFKTDSDAHIRLAKSDWPALRSAQEVSKAKIELPVGINGAWLVFMVDANARVTDNVPGGEWIINADYLHNV